MDPYVEFEKNREKRANKLYEEQLKEYEEACQKKKEKQREYDNWLNETTCRCEKALSWESDWHDKKIHAHKTKEECIASLRLHLEKAIGNGESTVIPEFRIGRQSFFYCKDVCENVVSSYKKKYYMMKYHDGLTPAIYIRHTFSDMFIQWWINYPVLMYLIFAPSFVLVISRFELPAYIQVFFALLLFFLSILAIELQVCLRDVGKTRLPPCFQ